MSISAHYTAPYNAASASYYMEEAPVTYTYNIAKSHLHHENFPAFLGVAPAGGGPLHDPTVTRKPSKLFKRSSRKSQHGSVCRWKTRPETQHGCALRVWQRPTTSHFLRSSPPSALAVGLIARKDDKESSLTPRSRDGKAQLTPEVT
ncbi:hypothetical protein E2C01_018222 [Portunus trituberculatus]|uniref:Uncharacterized protein n=1 Tax=Portunus trituberculatus TaxID=210409 RepID=A0A5B7DTY8_PORTR|nr:hypothetical protein [Portunus trituberculatus]